MRCAGLLSESGSFPVLLRYGPRSYGVVGMNHEGTGVFPARGKLNQQRDADLGRPDGPPPAKTEYE